MREIKFRAWNSRYNEMLYTKKGKIILPADNIYSTSEFVLLTHYMGDVCHESHVVGYQGGEIMQCTNLKDINNKEIYESDILRDEAKKIFIVEWYNHFWAVKSIETNTVSPILFNTHLRFEVLGNIYENPELLK